MATSLLTVSLNSGATIPVSLLLASLRLLRLGTLVRPSIVHLALRSASTRICLPPPSFVDHLDPVRHVLHSLLSDADAVRLLRVSRSFAHLLRGFTLHHHILEPSSVADIWRVKALYQLYDLRPTRMALPAKLRQLELEMETGRSPLPLSLTHLLMGPVPRQRDGSIAPDCIFGSKAADMETLPCDGFHGESGVEGSDAACRWWARKRRSCRMRMWAKTVSAFNCPLPAGLLPHGLLYLQFGSAFNTALTVGSIPSTLRVLQMGPFYRMVSTEGVLPSSLVRVHTRLPQQPVHLPPSLRHLSLGPQNEPLQRLPVGLRALHFEGYLSVFRGVDVPASLTHLSFAFQPHFDGPLPPRLVCLELNGREALLPGLLPPSLRVIRLGGQPLQGHWLPDGVQVLHSKGARGNPPLRSGDLPPHLVALRLGAHCKMDIEAGAIPASVRHLVLPARYKHRIESMKLSPLTQVDWC